MTEGRARFKVKTPLGVTVRTTEEYWKLITEFKHPIIKKYEKEVKETLKEPDEIRKSRTDETVFLYLQAVPELRESLYLRID